MKVPNDRPLPRFEMVSDSAEANAELVDVGQGRSGHIAPRDTQVADRGVVQEARMQEQTRHANSAGNE
jgi:hypothetical protein